MTTFYLNKKNYGPMPESYNELSGKQLMRIAPLFLQSITEEQLKLKALKIMLGKSFVAFAFVSADAKARMLPHFDWIFDKNTLTRQILPRYKNFIGPKEDFDNFTLSEFHFAEMYYKELVATNDETAMNNLVAVLYRKPKPGYDHQLDTDGDARRAFNANEISFHAKKIAGWPLGAKLAAIHFYDGCRQNLIENYDEVFKGDSGEDNDEGMFGVMRSIAESGTYGPFDVVEAMNIHTALMELRSQIREAAKITTPTTT